MPVEVDKMLRDLRERVAKLEEAVGKLQAKTTAPQSSAPVQAKKRKAENSGQPPPEEGKTGWWTGKG